MTETMPPPAIELSEAELDGLIERLEQAIAHDLALSVADLQCLLQLVLSFAHLHERLSERDITLHKLRKLAGIVQASEKLSHLLPKTSSDGKTKPPKAAKPKSEPPPEPVIHERCTHAIEGLQKGQACPECQRGKLYKYAPVTFLRFSGQTPLICTQHLLERLRCSTCGAYFTAELSPEAKQDGEVGQTYGYSARAMMALNKYYAGLPFYRQHTLQQLFGTPISARTVFEQHRREGYGGLAQPRSHSLKPSCVRTRGQCRTTRVQGADGPSGWGGALSSGRHHPSDSQARPGGESRS